MKLALLLAAVGSAAACGGGGGSADTAEADSSRTTTGASAEAECLRGEPQPVLRPVGARVPRFERRGKLGAVEELQLDDTTSLRLTHGGCAHYVMTYAFTVRGAVRDTADSPHWLARSVDLLRALPVTEDHQAEIDQVATALRTGASTPGGYRYGDAIRASELALVWATVRRAAPRGVVVEIVFDYSL